MDDYRLACAKIKSQELKLGLSKDNFQKRFVFH